MIVLIGHSGSGKSTVQGMLQDYLPKIVTYTTRPKREYELDGEDYNFTSIESFKSLKDSGFFIDVQQYREWIYGVPKQGCCEEGVLVIEPNGVRNIIDKVGRDNLLIVYVSSSEYVRRKRLEMRRDDKHEIDRRIESDRTLHRESSWIADVILKNYTDDYKQLYFSVERLYEAHIKPWLLKRGIEHGKGY